MSNWGSADYLIAAIVALLSVVVLFFVIRELLCWYWKLNRIVELLESIDRRLSGAEIIEEKDSQKSDPRSTY